MKRDTGKLALNKEIIRSLASLDLATVKGGKINETTVVRGNCDPKTGDCTTLVVTADVC
jgi:hypothetical protein